MRCLRITMLLLLTVAYTAMFEPSTKNALAGDPVSVRQSFDTDPGWDGFRNRLLPEKLPHVRQNFGYRRSNFAGGRSAGEIGGTVQRSRRRAWYAKEIPEVTLRNTLSASGKFAVTRAAGSSGLLFGWFNENSRGWRTSNSLGFRLDGNGGKHWVFYEYGTRHWQTGGGGAFEGERYQTTSTPPFPADGTPHEWSLTYVPQADGGGQITFRVDDRTYELPVQAKHVADGATFNRFGIWNVQASGDSMDVFFDDLVIGDVKENFDRDPNWSSEGNDVEFDEPVVRPYHNFGFSKTKHAGGSAGELGGIIFRDERPAYYAGPTGPLSLDDPLKASGTVSFLNAGSDSGIFLGWFDSETKRNKKNAEHEQRQRNYLSVMIEGPSRVGHYFRVAFSSADGRGQAPTSDPQTGVERPTIRPDGQVHRWSLEYSPTAAKGNGRIMVTFDGTTHSLDLSPQERADGASFDRFGLFNIQSGGHHVEIYFDDLAYTTSSR